MKQIRKIGFWFLVLFLLILICLPGIWIFVSAFRPNPEILSKPANWIPDRWTIHQFTQMFSINGYVSDIQVGESGITSHSIATFKSSEDSSCDRISHSLPTLNNLTTSSCTC